MKRNRFDVAAAEHELMIAGHEDGCLECARDRVRVRVRWAAKHLPERERAPLLRLIRDVRVVDQLVKEWEYA